MVVTLTSLFKYFLIISFIITRGDNCTILSFNNCNMPAIARSLFLPGVLNTNPPGRTILLAVYHHNIATKINQSMFNSMLFQDTNYFITCISLCNSPQIYGHTFRLQKNCLLLFVQNYLFIIYQSESLLNFPMVRNFRVFTRQVPQSAYGQCRNIEAAF